MAIGGGLISIERIAASQSCVLVCIKKRSREFMSDKE